MTHLLDMDLTQIRSDLLHIIDDCSKRGLRSTLSWAAELYHALCEQVGAPEMQEIVAGAHDPLFVKEFHKYTLAKSYFDQFEYDRAAYWVQNCESRIARFLHLYSLYCSGEKKVLDDMAELKRSTDNTALKALRAELEKAHLVDKLDGYGLYLYGTVLRKLQLEKQAIVLLCEAVHAEPLHWGAWLELAGLVADREKLKALSLPCCWMKHFFLAHTYLEIQMNESAVQIYTALGQMGFSKSSYVKAQMAIANHNMRDLDAAIVLFGDLRESDPHRLDNMDIYSNLLYVKEMRVHLSNLAHNCCNTDRYRVESCCVVGNFYSLRSQHEKAVVYFQRALHLDPGYLSAWTLMGHEYMEMKNTSSAVNAYRQAITVNPRDYRAWYGLGQTYEILKMSHYGLYYYRKAQRLRPYDARMMIALGDAFEELGRQEEAKMCYWKAYAVGGVEGGAIAKLARALDRLGETHKAAAAYTEFIRADVGERDDLGTAHMHVARYHLNQGELGAAQEKAQRALEFANTKEDAKSLLRQIAQLRSEEVREPAMDTEPASPMNLTLTP